MTGKRIEQRGLYFDEMEEGAVYVHAPGRTVTEADNVLFTTQTMNTQSLHLDAAWSAGTEFGEPLVNSMFTLSTLVGLSVAQLTQGTIVANLGFSEVSFPAPVRHGDTLYAETLMREEGYFETPESRLFHLVNLLWRARRIVVDIGLHTRGLTPKEAVDQLMESMPMPRRSAESEVRRYCAMPTYQLAYAVGRRELLSLRDAYRARAGSSFSPRALHTELLGYGGLPVSLARWGMGLDE